MSFPIMVFCLGDLIMIPPMKAVRAVCCISPTGSTCHGYDFSSDDYEKTYVGFFSFKTDSLTEIEKDKLLEIRIMR